MSSMPWIKQFYLCLVPSVPMGYLLIHGDQIWTKLYINRNPLPPSDSLKQLVEAEMDHMEDIRCSKTLVGLTNELEPKNYGGFFLTSGVELQFPLRVSIEDVEQARRLGSSLEMDLGLAKYRRKIEANSPIGDELISRLMLSDNAKRFIVQRQLQLANNGVAFCTPVFAWLGFSTAGYLFFSGMMPVVGGPIAFIATVTLVVAVYWQFMNGYKAYWIKKADEAAVEKGKNYLRGARDYFNSGMKFNRLMRQVLGEEGKKNIDKNGDLKLDLVSYSERLKNIEASAAAKLDKEGDW